MAEKHITLKLTPREEKSLAHVMANLSRLIRTDNSLAWMEGHEEPIGRINAALNSDR